MNIQLREQPATFSEHYGAIPIAFEVRECLAVEMAADGTVRLNRCAVEMPYTKDYDKLPGQHPQDWQKYWDLTKWCLCAAFMDGQHVGGVALVLNTAEVYGSRSDKDEASLWDIRVRPDKRNRGIGRQLLAFAEQRATSAGKRRLIVETQNNNLAACQFYASSGFTLRSLERFAYPTLPEEVQLVWSRELSDPAGAK